MPLVPCILPTKRLSCVINAHIFGQYGTIVSKLFIRFNSKDAYALTSMYAGGQIVFDQCQTIVVKPFMYLTSICAGGQILFYQDQTIVVKPFIY